MIQDSGYLPKLLVSLDEKGIPIYSEAFSDALLFRLDALKGKPVVLNINTANEALKMTLETGVDEKGAIIAKDKFRIMLALCEGHWVDVRIQRLSLSRSKRQVGYYWRVMAPFMRDLFIDDGWHGALGNRLTLDETHEWLKYLFNYAEIISPDGEPMRIGQSTTTHNTKQELEFQERVTIFAKDRGRFIPPPTRDPDQYYIPKYK